MRSRSAKVRRAGRPSGGARELGATHGARGGERRGREMGERRLPPPRASARIRGRAPSAERRGRSDRRGAVRRPGRDAQPRHRAVVARPDRQAALADRGEHAAAVPVATRGAGVRAAKLRPGVAQGLAGDHDRASAARLRRAGTARTRPVCAVGGGLPAGARCPRTPGDCRYRSCREHQAPQGARTPRTEARQHPQPARASIPAAVRVLRDPAPGRCQRPDRRRPGRRGVVGAEVGGRARRTRQPQLVGADTARPEQRAHACGRPDSTCCATARSSWRSRRCWWPAT